MTVAAVTLWGTRIGAVSVHPGERAASFQYDPEFVSSNIQLAPVRMPLRQAPYSFPQLPADAFHGLPGLLSDSLPDRWGHALVDAWLAAQGRDAGSFDVVERLCYVGSRGIGALQFEPALDSQAGTGADLQLTELVSLASEALAQRARFVAELGTHPDRQAISQLLQIGTSAGGARPKVIIAYNEQTGQVRSGQTDQGPGFHHWILKFDGVSGAGDRGLADPQGWGAVEYAYAQMAVRAGVSMTECRLLEEDGRRHFMTRRFDRTDTGGRLHTQTIAALDHVSFNEPGAYSYEQALTLMRRLGLDTTQIEQQFRRMVFNIVARNQDDHVKNISLIMNRDGVWSLSPAYDLTFAYNSGSPWLREHQMSVAGKRDGFTAGDLNQVARLAGLPRGRSAAILTQVRDTVEQWPQFAEAAGVPEHLTAMIGAAHRLDL